MELRLLHILMMETGKNYLNKEEYDDDGDDDDEERRKEKKCRMKNKYKNWL